MEPIIVPSISENGVYFIFREDGKEVRFSINKNMVQPDERLTIDEMNFIRETLLKPVKLQSAI